MKKLTLLLIGLLIVPALFLTSCDRGDDPSDSPGSTTPTAKLMADYMVQNNLDLNHILVNTDGEKFVVAPPATIDLVDDFLGKYYIMDIRNSNDFLAAHVTGANNVAFANILTEAANATKPILVVCYTGQTACFATGLLRMYGYSHTRALKWGMSGWNPNTASAWNNAITGNPAKGHSNWANTGAPTNIVYKAPVLSSLSTDAATILKERVEAIVTLGFQGVNGTDVLANPSNYFINNYFSENDYLGFGHINGAYRINPFTIDDSGYLGLDPADNGKVVTYCYTGQTSAVITAFLRVLGYDAYSLKFGMNGLYNSNPVWSSNKWSSSVPKNFPIISN